MKENVDKTRLEKEYKLEELRELAKEMGLSTDGKKAELVERIAAATVVTETDTTENISEAISALAVNAGESAEDTADAIYTATVRVIAKYKDLQRGQMQHAGDTFKTTEERAAQLIEANVAKKIE